MHPTTPITSADTTHPHEAHSSSADIDEVASDAAIVAGGAFRAVELAPMVLIGLLICPPLAILAVVVVVPLAVITLVLGLLYAVVATPYLLIHHFREHDRGHVTLLVHRLGHAGRALVDLAPHRIVAGARKVHSRP